MRALIVLCLLSSGCCWNPASSTPAPKPAPSPTPDPKAEAAVELAQKNGWVSTVDYQRGFATGSATVTPAFRSLDFKVRQAVAAEVAAAGMHRMGLSTFTVNLIDSSGRGVGTYSTVLARLIE